MKKIFLPMAMILGMAVGIHAEGVEGANARRVARSDGDHIIYLNIIVGTVTAVSPFANVSFGDGKLGQRRNLRSITVLNPSLIWDLLIGSGPKVNLDTPHWSVSTATGINPTLLTFNHTTFYMSYPDIGGSSDTVRLRLELGEKN